MANTNDENTRLLLHFDGVDGDTTLFDSAVGGSSPKLFQNGAALSDDDSKFGPTSLRCVGAEAHLIVNPHIDWAFGSSSFTVDGWFKISSNPYLFCWWFDSNNYLGLALVSHSGSGAIYRLQLRVAGVMVIETDTFGIGVMGAWAHVAVERKNDKLQAWADGDFKEAGVLPSSTYAINMQQWPLHIGAAPLYGTTQRRSMDGFVDEFRVHNGILIDKGGVLAGVEYAVETQQYPRIYSVRQRGTFPVRRNLTNRHQGEFDLGILHWRSRTLGGQPILDTHTNRTVGEHPILDGMTQRARGIFSIGLTTPAQLVTRKHTAVGRTVILRSINDRTAGEFNFLNGTYQQRTMGTHRIWVAATQRTRGKHALHIQVAQRTLGLHDINTSDDTYEVFHALDAEPDPSGTPIETFTTLPHELSGTFGTEGVHYFLTRLRSAEGVQSQNIAMQRIRVDAAGNQIPLAPTAPGEVTVVATANGGYRVTAIYEYLKDGVGAADKWALFITTDGSDPDPDVDTPIEIDMVKVDAIAKLAHLVSSGPGGQTIKVIVATRQTGGDDTVSSIVQTTTSITGPASPVVSLVKRVRDRGILVGA